MQIEMSLPFIELRRKPDFLVSISEKNEHAGAKFRRNAKFYKVNGNTKKQRL